MTANKSNNVIFESYSPSHYNNCLNLFDKNCPQFFAPNEREDYSSYLNEGPEDYRVGLLQGELVAAFGLDQVSLSQRGRVTWILVCPLSKGVGVGSAMMNQAKESARLQGLSELDIAASHLSAPFFEKFGAVELSHTQDGWGSGMHKVDMELIL